MSQGKLNPKQIRILAIAWAGIILLVGACTFVAILWTLNSQTTPQPEEAADVTSEPQAVDQPTAVPTTETAPEDSDPAPPSDDGGVPGIEPTIPPIQDTAFGYGIQARLDIGDINFTLDQVEQLGMTWLKQQIRWSFYEREPDVYEWGLLDAYFEALEGRNIKVMISVLAAPDWSTSVSTEGQESPPDDPADYIDFVVKVLERYPGQIHAVEVWNEQNLVREWYTGGGLSATAYLDLLSPTYAAVKAVDPNIIVISGALAPTGWNDPNVAIDDFPYLQQMIDAGLLNNVDCVGTHHNGYNIAPDIAYDAGYNDPTAIFRGPFDDPHHSWSFYSTLNGYHDIIVANGGDTPLCVTEFGWASVEDMGGDPHEAFFFAKDNTLEEQAEWIVEAYQLMHEWGFVKLAFLFNMDFSPKAGGNPLDDSALYSIQTPVGAGRPAWDAIINMAKPD